MPQRSHSSVRLAALWLIAGLIVGVGAWSIPVNLKSVTPTLLAQAGKETPTVGRMGRQLVEVEKPGPAALVLAAARLTGDPGAASLTSALEATARAQPELIPWGGWDPFLDPLFNLKENAGRVESTPVLTFFITEKARNGLHAYLVNSRSQGVRSLLATRAIDRTEHFVPAHRSGGQTLDAVILLSALLYQGEHFSGSLQRELRTLADESLARRDLAPLETFYIDLLSLGKRLDWVQLSELLRYTESTRTVGEYAHLARVAPDDLALIYTAALLSDSADRVAGYLIEFGRPGLEDLKLALSLGQGAVRQLVERRVPVNRASTPSFGPAAEIGLLYPRLALLAKYLGFLLGAFCLFRGLEKAFFAPDELVGLPRMKSGVLALIVAGLIVVGTEPFLLKAAPPSEFQIKLVIPVLASLSDPASLEEITPTLAMDTTTLLSIGFFAALQIAMYLICLLKIREIGRENAPSLLKLRLMENEENLFDGGLYVGIGGTATALVLQVLGVIEPNLLAAYSSNLFGITCVALVKIRHVRPYKRQLILDSQAAVKTVATV